MPVRPNARKRGLVTFCWTPIWEFLWHCLQFLGSTWPRSDTHKETESVVDYARKIIERGGAITLCLSSCLVHSRNFQPAKGLDALLGSLCTYASLPLTVLLFLACKIRAVHSLFN